MKNMNPSLSNPSNQTNPFAGSIDVLGGPTLKEEEIIKPGGGADPFSKGVKLDDPFGGKTISIEEASIKKSGGTNQVNPSVKNSDVFGGATLPEYEIKNMNFGNNYQNMNADPLGGPTLPEEYIYKQGGQGFNPFDPNVKLNDPFGGETL